MLVHQTLSVLHSSEHSIFLSFHIHWTHISDLLQTWKYTELWSGTSLGCRIHKRIKEVRARLILLVLFSSFHVHHLRICSDMASMNCLTNWNILWFNKDNKSSLVFIKAMDGSWEALELNGSWEVLEFICYSRLTILLNCVHKYMFQSCNRIWWRNHYGEDWPWSTRC